MDIKVTCKVKQTVGMDIHVTCKMKGYTRNRYPDVIWHFYPHPGLWQLICTEGPIRRVTDHIKKKNLIFFLEKKHNS
jgi:hypothetical protein